MNSERELYQEHYKTSRDYKFYIKHEMTEKQIFEFKNGKYIVDCVNDGWEIWQASTQRQGYKLVPVDEINIMDMIHGKCPCGSSRAPIISDKEGYNLIHCFSCGANKYIHEDY